MAADSRQVVVSAYGGPEMLELVESPVGSPGAGEVVVEVETAGVNFIDVYQRSGVYRPPLPFVPGMEGAGVVHAVGSGVDRFQVGDRVAWPYVSGSYTGHATLPAASVVSVPADVSLSDAGGLILQATTVQCLVSTVYEVSADDVVVVHAAAGGVGLVLVQVCKARGAVVVGTASTDPKRSVARRAGADVVVEYDGVEDAVRQVSDGRGASVVYDGVGRDTFDRSLASLRTRGCLVLYGLASGPVPPLDLQRLGTGGSLTVTRPRLPDFVGETELGARADEVFGWLRSGLIGLHPRTVYPLDRVADAHRDLEARRITGKAVLAL